MGNRPTYSTKALSRDRSGRLNLSPLQFGVTAHSKSFEVGSSDDKIDRDDAFAIANDDDEPHPINA